jgi:hypothetical protein
VRKHGGQTLAVHIGRNYEEVQVLQQTGRVMHTARADFREDSDADLWLMLALKRIADKISDQRERSIAEIVAAPGHVTE